MYRVLPDGLVKNEKIYIIDENDNSIDDDEICSDVCAGLVKQQCKVRTCKTKPIKLSQSTCHSSSTNDRQSTDDIQRTVRIPK